MGANTMVTNVEVIKLSEVISSNMQIESRAETYSPEKYRQLVSGYKEGRYIPPIRIRKSNGSYQCISGHMRLNAMIEAGVEEVGADDQKITLAGELADPEADLETLLENHSREDLRWWERAQQWKRYREKHGITQQQLADKLPDVSLDALKRIESASKLADSPELVIIITRLDLGYNSAQRVMRIPGGSANWERFLEAAEKHGMKVKDIDSYTKQLGRTKENPELLEDLLARIPNEKLSVDQVQAAIDEQLGVAQHGGDQSDDAASQVSEGSQTESVAHETHEEPGESQKGDEASPGDGSAEGGQEASPVSDSERADSEPEGNADNEALDSNAEEDQSTQGAVDDAPPPEQDTSTGETGAAPVQEEAATYDVDQRAREYIGMLEQLTAGLPDIIAKRLDEDDEHADIANELFHAIERFVNVAAEL